MTHGYVAVLCRGNCHWFQSLRKIKPSCDTQMFTATHRHCDVNAMLFSVMYLWGASFFHGSTFLGFWNYMF